MPDITIDKTLLGIIITIMLWLFLGLILEFMGKLRVERESRKLYKAIHDKARDRKVNP